MHAVSSSLAMLSVLSGDTRALEVTRETATTLLSPFTSLAVSSVTDLVMQTCSQQMLSFPVALQKMLFWAFPEDLNPVKWKTEIISASWNTST
jgi:hypothetical protein